MTNPFTQHPHSVGETYLQHMYFAQRFGFKLIFGGIAAIIHSIFPFVFQKTASSTAIYSIIDFSKRMKAPDINLVILIEELDKYKYKDKNKEL